MHSPHLSRAALGLASIVSLAAVSVPAWGDAARQGGAPEHARRDAGPDGNGPDEAWWSYRPLRRPAVPSVSDGGFVQNPIDAFVLARLQAAGLTPGTRASDATLIRRAYYDLTGLPPTPEEVAAYVADPGADKWTRLVDRLLDSPQYGVKWARHWLDVVRFAETDSFERDRLKPGAWRYRDWVVDAMNDDLPYGRFLTEQLAGDELEDATFATWVATGYHRLGIWDDEPTDPLQAVYDDFDGIVDTTARAMLGTSMGCARCHDHKKDPIPTTDYYRMLAFFEGVKPYKIVGSGGVAQGNFVRSLPVDLGHSDFQATLSAWQTQRAATLQELRFLADEAWSRHPEGARQAAASALDAGVVARLDFESEIEGVTKLADGRFGSAGRITRDAGLTIDRSIADDFSIALWFRAPKPGRGSPSDLRWFTGSGLVDGEVPGIVDDFGISLVEGHVAAGVGNPETFVSSGGGLADDAWHHVVFTRHRASGEVVLYVDGIEAGRAVGGKQALTAPPVLAVGRIQAGGGVFRGALDEIRIYDRVLDAGEVLDLGLGGGFGASTVDAVRAKVGEPEALRYEQALARLRDSRRPTRETAEVLCAQEAGVEVGPSFVRVRGSAHVKGEQVEPGYPQVLGGETETAFVPPTDGRSSGRRLAFARWLTRPDHPLTWRVAINRIWLHHFGRGIVRTPNEFGRLGERPTHPELLDWLASEFVARGGSVKEMHRLLMQSSTYQQSSAPDPVKFDEDPQNDLFWRFDMRRLTAEELRDSMLAVNGTLNLEMRGPGIYPEMPREALETSSRPDAAWGRSSPEQASRRTIYVHAKRSLLMPILQAFDLADTDTSCPVRFVTTLPTQALTMMNSDLVNKEAGKLAARLRAEREGLLERLSRGMELVQQRPPTDGEVARAVELHADLMAEHGVAEDEALRLCCLVFLNLNAFVYLD